MRSSRGVPERFTGVQRRDPQKMYLFDRMIVQSSAHLQDLDHIAPVDPWRRRRKFSGIGIEISLEK